MPVIAPFVKKPAAAQIIDSFTRSGGVRPNSVTMIVDTSITAIVMRLTLKRSASRPTTMPPLAPPTLVQLSTLPADDGAKPRSTTIFGTHFTMK